VIVIFYKIILDFDGVIGSSIASLCESLETIRGLPQGSYNPKLVKKWNFEDVIPDLDHDRVNDMFESDIFWRNLKPVKGSLEFIEKYKSDIIICTIGTNKNIQKKLAWIDKHIGRIDVVPIIINVGAHHTAIDKSIIDMQGCLLVDDNINAHATSNASHKILFDEYGTFNAEWQKGDLIGNLECVKKFDSFDRIDEYIQKYIV